MNALTSFGFGSLGLKLEDLNQPNKVVQTGFPPVGIVLITSISGVTWEESYSGNIKDLADLEAIGES